MKKILLLLLIPVIASAGRLQNEDFKTEAEITGAGGTVSQLLNDTKIYVTSVAKTLDDAIADGDIGGGSVGTNYIDNYDINNNDTGYNTYADAAGENPVDGTGGTASITVARNTTTPLRGTGDLKLTKTAVNEQGEGFSYDFTVAKADLAQKLTCSFEYDASDSDYADGDIRLSIYNKDSSQLIRVNGEDLQGGKGKHYFQFQTDSADDDYRLIYHVSSTSALAYDLYFDQIVCGPTQLARGAIQTAWEDYTPSYVGLGTVTTTSAEWRRDGDTMFLRGRFTMGTGTAVAASVSLPSGHTWEIPTSSSLEVGKSSTTDATYYDLSVQTESAISGTVLNFQNNAAALGSVLLGNAFSTSRVFQWQAQVKIQGWGANGTISEDLGGGDCELVLDTGNGHGSTNTAIRRFTNDNLTGNCVTYEDSATAGAKITINETSFYSIVFEDARSGGVGRIGLTKNSTQLTTPIEGVTAADRIAFNEQNIYLGNAVFVGELSRGDIIRPHTNGNSDATTYGKLKLIKIESGQTKFESATVAMFATNISGLSVSNASWVQSTGFVAETDTHGAFSSNEYTIATSGIYQLSATSGWSGNATGRRGVRIRVDNGDSGIGSIIDASSANVMTVTATGIKELTKGQVIKVEVYQNSGGSLALSTGADLGNNFSIARIK